MNKKEFFGGIVSGLIAGGMLVAAFSSSGANASHLDDEFCSALEYSQAFIGDSFNKNECLFGVEELSESQKMLVAIEMIKRTSTLGDAYKMLSQKQKNLIDAQKEQIKELSK